MKCESWKQYLCLLVLGAASIYALRWGHRHWEELVGYYYQFRHYLYERRASHDATWNGEQTLHPAQIHYENLAHPHTNDPRTLYNDCMERRREGWDTGPCEEFLKGLRH